MITAALRLQPLLARAQKLEAQDQAMPLTSAKNINGEVSSVFQDSSRYWYLVMTQQHLML